MKNGNCIITDGPAINATIIEDDKSYSYGDTVSSKNINIKIEFLSSKTFGTLLEATVYKGVFGNNSETILFNFNWNGTLYKKLIIKELKWNDHSGYVRFELKTTKGKYCLTNPIWIC